MEGFASDNENVAREPATVAIITTTAPVGRISGWWVVFAKINHRESFFVNYPDTPVV